MEKDISIARIANAICQDTTFEGVHLLVEGKQDYKLYQKFAQNQNVRIKTTCGKYRLREVYSLLIERGLTRVVGIRDADFLRIEGNPKYSADYAVPIFPTDCHDAEIMLARSGVLDDYLTLVTEPERINQFVAKHKPILDLVIEAIYPLGCLRLANRRFGLGLSFKPERPEGNQLKIRKFILESNWSTDIPVMINTVWEYSQNRGLKVASKDIIGETLATILSEEHPAHEVSNGHDFSAVLHIVLTRGFKSSNRLLQDPDCVQDLLIANYDLRRFALTSLYRSVQDWSIGNDKPLVFQLP